VSPTTGTLTTIVSQDPTYVLFPVAQRTALDLRSRYGPKGGFKAVVIRLRLPDGRIYDQEGRLDYVARGAGSEHHSFTGVRMGAPLPFSSTTTNLAGSVLLALRPTT
jgi:membrane fusion protein, multidrug efflux system